MNLSGRRPPGRRPVFISAAPRTGHRKLKRPRLSKPLRATGAKTVLPGFLTSQSAKRILSTRLSVPLSFSDSTPRSQSGQFWMGLRCPQKADWRRQRFPRSLGQISVVAAAEVGAVDAEKHFQARCVQTSTLRLPLAVSKPDPWVERWCRHGHRRLGRTSSGRGRRSVGRCCWTTPASRNTRR